MTLGGNMTDRDHFAAAAQPSAASGGSVSIGEAQNTGSDEWYCPWYLCPECKKDYINRAFNYCPNCGVKIEWQE